MKLKAFFTIALILFIAGSTAAAVQVVEGEVGPGALYAIFVPDDWNGDLILYAHGFVDAARPTALPTADEIEPLRDRLNELGYAVAYSSYSENGLAVKDGAQRTKQLRGIFVSEFGTPDHTYLMGHSLGGLVNVLLAEKHPNLFDGALPMCGIIGGSQAQIDYIANVRVVFDFFYPGVLPGDALNVPEGLDLQNDVILPVILAIQANPAGAGAISAVGQSPVPWSTPAELVESIVRAIGFNFRGFEDVLRRTHGHSPFDNTGTVYAGFLPQPILDALNALADRFSSTPDAENYMENFYQPTGELEIPVLTLHNVLDPVAPLLHEPAYQMIVAEAGSSGMLVQRTVNRYGHCEFEVQEMVQAFQDLEDWVENGVTPSP